MAAIKTAQRVREFREAHGAAYSLLAFAGCALSYYIVLELFLGVPLFNNDVQIRPASGLGPVLGLFFGIPGILGCSVGNLVSDMASESDPATLGIYFLIQVAYNALPYLVWYAVYRKRAFPFPRLDSSGKVAAYLVIMVVDAVAVTLLLLPLETDTMQVMDINAVRALNNAIFLVYLGIPVLLALEFSPLVPLSPPFVRVTYENRAHVNMTQRFVIPFLFMTAVMIALFNVLGFGPYFVDGSTAFGELVSSIYTVVALLTVFAFVPMLLFLRYMETHFTRPIEVLTAASESFVNQVEAHEDGTGPLEVSDVPESGIRPRGEIRGLFDSTNKMRLDVAHSIDRVATVTAERERTAAELDIARRIQMGAVPHDFLPFKEHYRLDVDAFMRPALEVGGDFYDVFDAGEGRVGFVIGDVSGKGVPAALFMMRAQSLIKEHVLASDDLGTAMTLANRPSASGWTTCSHSWSRSARGRAARRGCCTT